MQMHMRTARAGGAGAAQSAAPSQALALFGQGSLPQVHATAQTMQARACLRGAQLVCESLHLVGQHLALVLRRAQLLRLRHRCGARVLRLPAARHSGLLQRHQLAIRAGVVRPVHVRLVLAQSQAKATTPAPSPKPLCCSVATVLLSDAVTRIKAVQCGPAVE